MDEVNRLYEAKDRTVGTHIALRWKGRLRYTVPREAAGQQACWQVFRPGVLGIALRAMARLPGFLGSIRCTESGRLKFIREAIGKEAGLSCCRTGAAGPWSKDTILLLDNRKVKPLYLVKAGAGEEVDALLRNEADWLLALRNQPSLVKHIPEYVAHRSGVDLCFVAQSAVSGNLDFRLGELQVEFLRRLQDVSRQSMRYEESGLCRTLNSRMKDLSGSLPESWSMRLEKAMRQITDSLSDAPTLFVDAHNDFTPWNIRIQNKLAHVFDWEYAAHERLPLFDPLHFVLLPMALGGRPTFEMVRKIQDTVRLCQQWLGKEFCYQPKTQALAYLVNVCTLYLWSVRGNYGPDAVVESYAGVINSLCP